MRHERNVAALILCVTVAAASGGCANHAHRDVMLFGTETKLAIDVAARPETQTPEFTVGYKRREFVYLPLSVNGTDRAPCTVPPCAASPALYQGSHGGNPATTDAYSVFASFGADFGGGSTATDGGLAQFFATGIAAQRLGENTGISQALAVQPSGADIVAAQDQAISVLRGALSDTDRKLAMEQVEVANREVAGRAAMIDGIVALSRKNGTFDPATWQANVARLPDADFKTEKAMLSSIATEADARRELTYFHARLVGVLYRQLTQ